jgi:hypothetical protein
VGAPLNVGTTNQVKDGNLSVGRSTNAATDNGLVVYGAEVVKGQLIGEAKGTFGLATANYLPAAANWSYNLQLNGTDDTSIGFHDAGNSVSSIRFNGGTGFTIGGDDGWGLKQVGVPGGLRFGDGTVQTTAAAGSPTGSGFIAQNTTFTIAQPFKYVLFMGVYNSSDSGPAGGYVYPVGAAWQAGLYAAGVNNGPVTLSATEQCVSGVSYICLTRPAGGGLRVRTTNVSTHYLVF